MKFLLNTHVPWPEGKEPAQVYDEIGEEVQYAEQLGFHSAWLAEHHFSRYGVAPSQLMLATKIAAQTKSIRLGTAVMVPPLHHPIQLAEEIAMFDQLSGGRLDIGYGRGSAPYEYNGYNIDRDESQARFQEVITIVEGLLTTPDFSYDGAFYTLRHVNLVPPPAQKPCPPIYIAATRTPATLDFVAASGHPIIVGVVLDTPDALELCSRFIEKAAVAGHQIPMARIPFFRYVFVAETEEEALRDARESVEWTLDMIQWRGSFTSGGSEVYQRLEDFRKSRTSLPLSFEHIAEHRGFFGTPDQVAARIHEVEAQGIELFGATFAFGSLDHAKVMQSMELFSREVMPRFQAVPAG
jgi:alkanesulfonate monooxygenase SsuD/methylene tetrahydromethanopterin reductase-like flavin-dependent oxidoreductase (luciferase family)